MSVLDFLTPAALLVTAACVFATFVFVVLVVASFFEQRERR